MLDKEEMVMERDFGVDTDLVRGRNGERRMRDSAGSEGRLVSQESVRESLRDRVMDGGMGRVSGDSTEGRGRGSGGGGRYEMTGWGNSGARYGSP